VSLLGGEDGLEVGLGQGEGAGRVRVLQRPDVRVLGGGVWGGGGGGAGRSGMV
jgi:hypothetical protein